MIFPGGSVTPGSRRPNIWSVDSACKTKNWYIALQVYFKHFKNSSFLAEFHYFYWILAKILWHDFLQDLAVFRDMISHV